jgi:competence protein ComEC
LSEWAATKNMQKTRLHRIKTVGKMALIFLCGLLFYIHHNWPDQSIHLIVCDVGQGDAILIYQGFSQVLIDSSQDERVLGCLNRFLPPWDRVLDLVLITHYDHDHVGGLASVLTLYQIRTMLTTEPPAHFIEQNPKLMQLINLGLKHGMQWKRPILGQKIRLGSSLVETWLETITAPPGLPQVGESLTENDRSIVVLLTAGKVRILLTGDLETKGEQQLVASGRLVPVDILKVGHHGSKTSSTPVFLETIRPKIALISAGRHNQYGHPAPEVMSRFAEMGIQTLVTADVGNIIVDIDEQTYRQHSAH